MEDLTHPEKMKKAKSEQLRMTPKRRERIKGFIRYIEETAPKVKTSDLKEPSK